MLLIDMRKLVGVEECEANIGEGARVQRDIGGLKVRHELGVGVELLVERKFLAGVFLDSIPIRLIISA